MDILYLNEKLDQNSDFEKVLIINRLMNNLIFMLKILDTKLMTLGDTNKNVVFDESIKEIHDKKIKIINETQSERKLTELEKSNFVKILDLLLMSELPEHVVKLH